MRASCVPGISCRDFFFTQSFFFCSMGAVDLDKTSVEKLMHPIQHKAVCRQKMDAGFISYADDCSADGRPTSTCFTFPLFCRKIARNHLNSRIFI